MSALALTLGLVAAASYGGGADFLGGTLSRRAPVLAVLIAANALSLPILVLLVATTGGEARSGDALLGAGAGAATAVGIAALYRALAMGCLAVAAPVSAVLSAVVPVGLAAIAGERLGPRALLGATIAMLGVAVCASHGQRLRIDPRQLALASVAGAALGTALFLVSHVSAASALWPIAALRCTALVLFVAVARAARSAVKVPASLTLGVAAIGTLELAGQALFLVSTRYTVGSLAAVLASLYPAVTIVLARVVLDERISAVQSAALLTSGAGNMLMAGAT